MYIEEYESKKKKKKKKRKKERKKEGKRCRILYPGVMETLNANFDFQVMLCKSC